MRATTVLETTLGPVEVMHLPGDKPAVLFFPGGHCDAAVDCGWSIYRSLGHGVLSFSRPGYGRTSVGQLTAQEFVPAVRECCEQLGIQLAAAAVGVSFGGMQAIHVAVAQPVTVHRLVLHSCAPSTRPYPDTRSEALLGPIVFAPGPQRLVWAAIERLVRTDAGLRRMVAALSARPLDAWWPTWSTADRARARELFRSMSSGAGFVNDLRQGHPDRAAHRRLFQTRVRCPTLVTASRADAGVAFGHAEDLARTIPNATLVELDSPSHLFWIGPERVQVERAVRAFLAADA
ncbi:putative hydrolase YcgS [Cellulomonas chitinilytica]|uniref:Hydrolase YcgS n=1 Tax=Cellulomonas chitinilytica TaxID=398759 RepID=A0A919P9C4_9CELL|nr:alpha/beta hydrolase [Cellulomonas chitinilytica]GIG23644.1 putative hydrolase YcgS [Cellulomonas chitinilytica]